jgi:hypothetical protein
MQRDGPDEARVITCHVDHREGPRAVHLGPGQRAERVGAPPSPKHDGNAEPLRGRHREGEGVHPLPAADRAVGLRARRDGHPQASDWMVPASESVTSLTLTTEGVRLRHGVDRGPPRTGPPSQACCSSPGPGRRASPATPPAAGSGTPPPATPTGTPRSTRRWRPRSMCWRAAATHSASGRVGTSRYLTSASTCHRSLGAWPGCGRPWEHCNLDKTDLSVHDRLINSFADSVDRREES